MVHMNARTHLFPSGIFPYSWHTLYIHVFFFGVSEKERNKEGGEKGKSKNDDKSKKKNGNIEIMHRSEVK